jgi:hypothetical protein
MSRSRKWVFTYNNYPEDCKDFYESLEAMCSYYSIGEEVGESGTPHLQGFIYFPNAKTLSALKKFNKQIHWEKAITIDEAILYTQKDGKFREYGVKPMSQKRKGEANIERWEEAYSNAKRGLFDDIPADIMMKYYGTIKTIAKDYMKPPEDLDDVCGIWLYGEPGVGKSYGIRQKFESLFDKPCNKWWDGYQQEEVILLDDFDKNHKVLGHHLKRWADRYSFTAEIKGSAISIRPKYIVVTSNYVPEDIFEDGQLLGAINRRFRVLEVTKDNRCLIFSTI